VKELAPGGGGSENDELITGRWLGGGGSVNAFGLFVVGLFIDMLDIEFPMFPMEESIGFVAGVPLLLDQGFETGVLQFIEVKA
jgi:hypothetical protein